jgi:hypothetical protein
MTTKSLVSSPDAFDGTDYAKFERQLAIYFAFNAPDFTEDERKILGCLSYMKGGTASLFAQNFIDGVYARQAQAVATNADETNSPTSVAWGTWTAFLEQMRLAFKDPNQLATSQHKLSKLMQGKNTAEEFFGEFDQLRRLAGYSEGHDQYLIELLERALKSSIVYKIYSSDPLPTTYQEFRLKALRLDALERRLQTVRPFVQTTKNFTRVSSTPAPSPSVSHPTPVSTSKGYAPMDVDRRSTFAGRNLLCWKCHQPGHIAKDCPNPKGIAAQIRAMSKKERTYLLEAIQDMNSKDPEDDGDPVKEVPTTSNLDF